MRYKEDKIVHVFAVTVLTVMSVLSLIPFVLLIMSSISSEKSLISFGYSFFPREISIGAYQYLIGQAGQILKAYATTVAVTAIGTTVSLIIVMMAAYPLSRDDFAHRNVILFLFFFTMLFNGGLVPSYIMWTNLFHIKNTYLAYILPGMLANAMSIVLIKNYFKFNVPVSLIEAARLDGAGEIFILKNVVIPLSKPIVAVIGLNTGLAYWNDWMNGLYYINKPEMYNIQVLLNRILNDMQYISQMYQKNLSDTAAQVALLPMTSARMAIAVIVVLPILLVFPFFQKYFIKGIVVGAVKG